MRRHRSSYRRQKLNLHLPQLRVPKYSFWWVLIIIVLLIYVWEQIEVVRLAQNVTRLKKEIVKWENNNRYLRIKIEAANSPHILEGIAKAQGMVFPASGAVKVLAWE